jgi:hypothetical protein
MDAELGERVSLRTGKLQQPIFIPRLNQLAEIIRPRIAQPFQCYILVQRFSAAALLNKLLGVFHGDPSFAGLLSRFF